MYHTTSSTFVRQGSVKRLVLPFPTLLEYTPLSHPDLPFRWTQQENQDMPWEHRPKKGPINGVRYLHGKRKEKSNQTRNIPRTKCIRAQRPEVNERGTIKAYPNDQPAGRSPKLNQTLRQGWVSSWWIATLGACTR